MEAVVLIFMFLGIIWGYAQIKQAILDNIAQEILSEYDLIKIKADINFLRSYREKKSLDISLLTRKKTFIPGYCPLCDKFSMSFKLGRFGPRFYCNNSPQCEFCKGL